MEGKRLYKTNQNKLLCGVCAGVAEYINLDPSVVRLLWVLLSCMAFAGVILYIVAALILPEKSTLM